MRTLFDASLYGMRGIGGLSGQEFGRPVRLSSEDHAEVPDGRMGCKKCAKKHRRMSGPTLGHLPAVRLGDVLTETAKEAWHATLALYGDLIKALPASAVGVYDDEMKRCQAMAKEGASASDYYAATQCLRSLYKDIKERKGAPEEAPRTSAPSPAKDSFPIVPVAVAGAGIIGLVVALTKI